MQGLDTATPTLELEDGTILHGTFEETVGTQLVFSGKSWPFSHAVGLYYSLETYRLSFSSNNKKKFISHFIHCFSGTFVRMQIK